MILLTGEDKNRIVLSGRIVQEPVYSHTAYGEDFFIFRLSVVRRSGKADEINVVVSHRLFASCGCGAQHDERVRVRGQIRTYNEHADGRMHLRVLVFCRDIAPCTDEICDENSLVIDGFLCRPPVRRTSPLGRELCDLMLAVNRPYGKSDYIPCIVWGRNASFAASLTVGCRVRLSGRFQSRDYRKLTSCGEYEMRRAYEVSANVIEVFFEEQKSLFPYKTPIEEAGQYKTNRAE